ncbi:aminotransferase class V-fold PLP-dependent enzyme [Sphingomicrobium astaxanthinifaciens]|uniref:aminotransferase class V-fold PLP-dependent enzyme n=1 Tax=Sphingomicrobium astaxanthinifaciens TaxID=1227949 RepID=UPI001FCB96F9|nr:aminotransferase class V-fold PLP-dependent enzyme [Sphingomicrobium astaxanthinifaciens]MCJ7421125.1 aminotransferase class V-fold PLP-dependent enzyme [Sphingomicrobium astaxanthinifaciens]
MSFKRLFSRSLEAAPGRLHVAAHSHHLWPDASRAGQVECWDDAARLADHKWDRVMGEVWPEAAANVAAELGIGAEQADRIVFAANTHDFLLRLAAACPRRARGPLRVLASDGEFHSARRQFARWVEAGEILLETVPVAPFDDFAARFAARAASGQHDLVMVSQLLFGTGQLVDPLAPIIELADPDGPWVVIDGYHSFMAIEAPFAQAWSERAFFLGGGYKYAMAGEGMGFMCCPPGFGERPPLTGWYAEFEDLSLPPGMVGYAKDAMRFMGATFDPSALYRFNAVRRMLAGEGLDTAAISAHVAQLQARAVAAFADSPLGAAELLNPLGAGPHARFLAYRHADAARWCAALKAADCVTDVRGEVIRFGFGLYHDADDVDRLAALVRAL